MIYSVIIRLNRVIYIVLKAQDYSDLLNTPLISINCIIDNYKKGKISFTKIIYKGPNEYYNIFVLIKFALFSSRLLDSIFFMKFKHF